MFTGQQVATALFASPFLILCLSWIVADRVFARAESRERARLRAMSRIEKARKADVFFL